MTSMQYCEKHSYWHHHSFDCAHCAKEKELTSIVALQARVAELEAINTGLCASKNALLIDGAKVERERDALRADAERYRAALVEVAAIKDQEYGLDWEEIELARSIANTALAARGAG